jgi:hypothetical protein
MTLDELKRREAALVLIADEAGRAVEDVRADIAAAEGKPLEEAWHRAQARGDHEGAHRAWLRMMAEHGIKRGEDPAKYVHDDAEARRAELRAEVERLKAEAT